MTRLEPAAHCLSAIGKQEYASMILSSTDKRMKVYHPLYLQMLYDHLVMYVRTKRRFSGGAVYLLREKASWIETDLNAQDPNGELEPANFVACRDSNCN